MSKLLNIYKNALLLYPASYRKRYGLQIIQTMEDILEDHPKTSQRLGIWLKELALFPGNVLEQHIVTVAQKSVFTPGVLIGIVALGLLAPFFIAMLIDEVSEHMYNRHLYDSWFWSTPILTIWVVVLPLLSLFVSFVAYVIIVVRTSVKTHRVSLCVRRLWPLILAIVISSGVLFVVAFRDSSSCWRGGGTNVNQAIRCVENVFMSSDKT